MTSSAKSHDSRSKDRLCPYCQYEFPDPIKRKKKCPACGGTILVRQGVPLTEEEATIKDWLAKLDWLGVTRRKFDTERRVLSERFGKTASVNDTLWGLLNEMVGEKYGHEQRLLYHYMADIVRSEGKDPTPYIESEIRLSLIEYQREGVRRVEISGARDSYVCPACQQHDGRVFTVQEALHAMPIPSCCTSHYGCRCMYLPVTD
jgi:hypothetical protein